MKKADRDRVWMEVTKHLVPNLRGTEVTERGSIMLPLKNREDLPRWMNKPERIRLGTLQYNTLKWIWQGGEEGRRYTDIQLYMIGGEEAVERGPQSEEDIHTNDPQVWDRRRGEYRPRRRNPLRGLYSSWLSYTMPRFCTKLGSGRWKLTEPMLLQHFNNVVK